MKLQLVMMVQRKVTVAFPAEDNSHEGFASLLAILSCCKTAGWNHRLRFCPTVSLHL